MAFRIQVEYGATINDLTDKQKVQIPYATSRALNNVAWKARQALNQTIGQVFDRPTPFTQSSVLVKESKKTDTPIEAVVYLRDDAAKGTPPSKYLAPEVFGGPRRQKRMEKSLQHAGYLPAGFYVVPAKGLPLDGYGNITQGLATKILSGLRASFDPYQNRPRRKRGTAPTGDQYFVGKPAGGRYPMGVWLRQGRKLTMLLMFTKQPQYVKRFPFFEVTEKTVREAWPGEFQTQLQNALRTAR